MCTHSPAIPRECDAGTPQSTACQVTVMQTLLTQLLVKVPMMQTLLTDLLVKVLMMQARLTDLLVKVMLPLVLQGCQSLGGVQRGQRALHKNTFHLVLTGLLYKAYPNACQHRFTSPAEAKALPCEGALALVIEQAHMPRVTLLPGKGNASAYSRMFRLEAMKLLQKASASILSPNIHTTLGWGWLTSVPHMLSSN